MDVTLRFNPAKATYGLLLGIAKFTSSNSTLREIIKAIENHNLTSNLQEYCECIYDDPDDFDNVEFNVYEWPFYIKTIIVLNTHSSCSLHRMLIDDKDERVRENTARLTRYPKLITDLCKNSHDIKVIIGLLKNKHLTGRQFDIIYKRLIEELFDEFLCSEDLGELVNECLFRNGFTTDEQKKEVDAYLGELFNARF